MDVQLATEGRLYSVLVGQPNAVLLLGAGASLKSGIPLAGGVVEKAARWAFAREHGRLPDDPRLQRSDWLPWLRHKPWYKEELSAAENYHAVVEHLLQPRQDRSDFFIDLINPGVDPSIGYEKLAEFMHRGIIHTALTTNFDEALSDVRRKLRGRPHHLSLIRTESDYVKFSTNPPHPQLVYVHGSVEHYTDLNILDEVQRLDDRLVRMLVPLLRDHPLIVIGYRGGEPSVMSHLLLENAEEANYFRHGIYWCMLKSERPEDLPPLVKDLASAIGRNFQLIPIGGFDELLAGDLWPRYQEAQPGSQTYSVQVAPSDSPTLDMKPLTGLSVDDLEWTVLRDRIASYCRVMDIRVPDRPDRAWITERLVAQDLAIRTPGGEVQPTAAGYLLFAKVPQDRIMSARVVIRIKGSPEWMMKVFHLEAQSGLDSSSDVVTGEAERVVEGNLWHQLDAITDALAVLNRPFRMKGGVSETVYPYPPLALKEIIVNALVHRDYSQEEPVVIEIEPAFIRVTNPGGLVEEVRRRVDSGSIEAEIRKGERGIKGYRNPVIADLFYGAGAMDKAGSGLADVYKLVSDNAGDVRFGPIRDNSAFEALIYCRPEAVDEVTRTASPLVVTSVRYAANTLEVLELPEVIWHAGTDYRRGRDVWAAAEADWLPPYEIFGPRLYSFHDLTQADNPLHHLVHEGDVEVLSLDEFGAGEDGRRHLVRMLNLSLRRHLEARGLIVDLKRMRAYFPRTEEGPRQITYQARLRQATRTVVKARKSSSTGKVRYWEHKALSFHFECFGDTWGLQIVPGYVFTWDGLRGLLAPERVNVLSTRRSARDYNSGVHNDLVFWAWLLAGGEEGSFSFHLSPGMAVAYGDRQGGDGAASDAHNDRSHVAAEEASGPRVVLSSNLPSVVVNDVELSFGEDELAEPLEDLIELDEELARLADEERLAGSAGDPDSSGEGSPRPNGDVEQGKTHGH